MLEPRFTIGDVVVYGPEWSSISSTGTIVDGPYREGIWWEYTMRDGSMVRDGEISHLIHRISDHGQQFDSGL